MSIPNLTLPRRLPALPVYCLLVGVQVALCPVGWCQYTPEHPKVQQMVDRGLQFLSTQEAALGRGEYAAGEAVLIGYVFLKTTGDVDHPQVKRAIDVSLRLANGLMARREQGESKIVYEASLTALFLASVDPGKYQPQLQTILDWLESVQKPHGGFGYLPRPTGDTSQVQYAVLAMWTLDEVGLSVPVRMVEETIRYLKSTQDPSGAWGYQGTVSNGPLVSQAPFTKSLATAGAGALIIAGDILKFYGERRKAADDDEGVPAAFVRIDLRKKLRAERREITLSRSDTQGAVDLARRFQNANDFAGSDWYYYWRYSQERYESFVEIIENKQNASPDWYNRGVQDLAGRQAADGSWGGPQGRGRDLTTVPVSTSFAILFLIRSTQTAIGKLDEGVTFGGYGLPNDVTTIKMIGDRIVSDAETSVENLLSMLEQDGVSDVQMGLVPDDLQLSRDPTQRKEQVARLSRLLSSGDYRARRVAAKLLGRSEDLNQVPDLIYALTDKDPHVPAIAEESLRLLSRKLMSGQLKPGATLPERQAAEQFWKEWYWGLRPDYIFIDR